MNQKITHGFSILEQMICLAIIGVLLSINVPTFERWQQKEHIKTEFHALHQLLRYARMQAMLWKTTVTVCPMKKSSCSSSWEQSIVAFIDKNKNKQLDHDDVVLRQYALTLKQATMTSSRNARITFSSLGQTMPNSLIWHQSEQDLGKITIARTGKITLHLP